MQISCFACSYILACREFGTGNETESLDFFWGGIRFVELYGVEGTKMKLS